VTAVNDTIAAIATAAGVGGVGIVRVSGSRAVAIVADILHIQEGDLDKRVRLGHAHDQSGGRIDQVLAFAMRAPASFTGEDVAELHGHGGQRNLAALLGAVVERGARVAEPGEFTRRAVTNGKLDLLRAEALLEVIHAGSERAWRLAQANLGGQLGEQVIALERRGLATLAELEGRIDFPDDDLDVADDAWLETELAHLEAACASLAESFQRGRAVSHGISLALVGSVNVGKSSLLNALVGRERALVAEKPGTTRDYLEISDVWNGVRVTIVDTAGTRQTADRIEQRGIALGEQRVASTDVVVVIIRGVDSGIAESATTRGARGRASSRNSSAGASARCGGWRTDARRALRAVLYREVGGQDAFSVSSIARIVAVLRSSISASEMLNGGIHTITSPRGRRITP
jgi:tRNA modification GTPase